MKNTQYNTIEDSPANHKKKSFHPKYLHSPISEGEILKQGFLPGRAAKILTGRTGVT